MPCLAQNRTYLSQLPSRLGRTATTVSRLLPLPVDTTCRTVCRYRLLASLRSTWFPSGLLLCARTPEARRRLTDLLVAKTAIAAAAVTAASTPAGTGGAAAATAVPAARATGVGIRAAASAPGGTYQEGPAHGAQPPGEHTENANGSGAALALVSCRGPATDIGSSGAQAPAAATSGAGGGMGGAGGGCVLPLRKIYRALVQGLVAEDQVCVDGARQCPFREMELEGPAALFTPALGPSTA